MVAVEVRDCRHVKSNSYRRDKKLELEGVFCLRTPTQERLIARVSRGTDHKQYTQGVLQVLHCSSTGGTLESPLAICMRESSLEAREVLFPKVVACGITT